MRAHADLDHHGPPDLGYGTCVSDPDPTDTYYEDAAMPALGSGADQPSTKSPAGLRLRDRLDRKERSAKPV
jgi:hypothetical protein